MTDATAPNRAREALGMDARQGQPSTELTTLDNRIARTRAMQSAFADAIASGLTPERLIRDAITAIRNTPKLAECDEQTFFGAIMSAGQLGLRPNVPSLGHGWVLPYWSGKRRRYEAQWILGYQGMVELGYRSGIVQKITATTIYENEEHEIRRGTDDRLHHVPMLDEEKRGRPIWHYAVVWLSTGQPLWEAISDARAQAIRDRFGARNRQGNLVGPWVDDYEAMARKTPLRAVWRWMPKTEILSLALATDNVIRAGVNADPGEPEPAEQRESVTVSVTEPEQQGNSEVVDAELVPDASAEPPQDDAEPQGATEQSSEPDSSTSDAQGVAEPPRSKLNRSAVRKALIATLEERAGAAVGDVIHAVTGLPSSTELDYVTTDELREALAWQQS